MHLVHHVAALAISLWLLWLPGWWIERRASVDGPTVLRFFTRFLAGFAAWTVSLFGLAVVGLYRDEAFLALAVVFHLLALSEGIRDGSRPRWPRPALVTVLFGSLAVVMLAPLFVLTITPSISWDAQVYHLTLPKLYLEAGGFVEVPMSVYSHWPHGLSLLFGAAMAIDSTIAAKVLHFACGLLVAVGLIRLGPGRAGWLAAAFFLANDVVLFEMRSAYIDLAYAFALLGGVVLASRADEEPKRRGALVAVGLAAGLLIALKVTGVVSAAVLALLLVPRWLEELRGGGARSAGLSLAAFALPAAAVGAPWWIKTWIYTGNPFYPWLWSRFGGPDWSVDLGQQLATWQRGIGMGRELMDYVLLPWRVVTEGGRGYDRFDGEIALFWLLVAPIALLALRASTPGAPLWRRMVLAAGLHAAFWAATSQQMRFLIPVLPLLAAPAAAAIAHLMRPWLEAETRRRRLAAVAAATLVATVWVTDHGKLVGAGMRLLPAFLHPTTRPTAEPPPVFEHIARLPATARVLFLNTNRGFYSARPYLADSFFEASQINDWLGDAETTEEIRDRLRRRDISHVLFAHVRGGIPFPRPLFELLQDPTAVDAVFSDGRYTLLELER